MGLLIKDVDESNWREIVALSVSKDQEAFIEKNGQSLLEAAYDVSLNWQPLALYDDRQLIVFSMIGAKQDKSMWLDRLMIDAKFQGKHYGSLFIPLLINFMKEQYEIERIYLSVHEENKKIIPYYQRFGFIDSQRHDPENGERVMYLDL
ncbi:GNAT family N-acetyltransferase [Enterococcus avium]|uniref:GNAT family N-acetyltransferase n=1 Tax=Enterococcus avium TaxID=33945 RepID=UPI00288E086A|nr:GNAT family N-acetyltransferase [Enterococcus avium]MDT2478901.1 GNAT family N-acetyltransferase [Enterococcus avium]